MGRVADHSPSRRQDLDKIARFGGARNRSWQRVPLAEPYANRSAVVQYSPIFRTTYFPMSHRGHGLIRLARSRHVAVRKILYYERDYRGTTIGCSLPQGSRSEPINVVQSDAYTMVRHCLE
ncbi:hypothetical protein EV130_101146 [Rhizobium azibense]|uniref:Uncharacterized protein n=1 Tax=Rhizobium azibense TaxID=1136135 RepID=A0A4R3S158_9HYPH|nr:hypothetical protein EV130_101146 [Rhizobium azibense]TCU41414.1 hypothetical protein EV129_101705 [Rhizobium azibense]